MVNGLEGCIFVGHTNTGTRRLSLLGAIWHPVCFLPIVLSPFPRSLTLFLTLPYTLPFLDMDSVASAIGAAYLFNGTAARAEESLNGEITFALEYAGYQSWLREEGRQMPGAILGGDKEGLPPFFPRIPGATDPFSDRGICLVDCNAPEQMVAEVGAVAFPPPSTAEEETIPRAMAMRRRIRGQD